MRSEGGSSGSVVRTQKQCTRRAAGGHEQRAGLAHEPHAQLAALECQARRALELALFVSEQIAEQTLGGTLRAFVARALGTHDARAPERVPARG